MYSQSLFTDSSMRCTRRQYRQQGPQLRTTRRFFPKEGCPGSVMNIWMVYIRRSSPIPVLTELDVALNSVDATNDVTTRPNQPPAFLCVMNKYISALNCVLACSFYEKLGAANRSCACQVFVMVFEFALLGTCRLCDFS